MEFEERSLYCSPGHAGKEGPHLVMTGVSRGFSQEVRRGAQGASRVVPGKSGLQALGEWKRVIALESW